MQKTYHHRHETTLFNAFGWSVARMQQQLQQAAILFTSRRLDSSTGELA
jgi:hypothetical protein